MRETLNKIQKEVKKNTIMAVTAAFAFLIALVWRDAISEAINKFLEILNLTQTGYLYKIISALIITLICVIGITIANRQIKK